MVTINSVDILFLIGGILIGLVIPHGHRYARSRYSSYRRRRY